MIELLTGISPTLWAIVGGIVAGAMALWKAYSAGKKSADNKHRAKEADAYERHLEELARANRARNAVDAGRLPDDDPYRRD